MVEKTHSKVHVSLLCSRKLVSERAKVLTRKERNAVLVSLIYVIGRSIHVDGGAQ